MDFVSKVMLPIKVAGVYYNFAFLRGPFFAGRRVFQKLIYTYIYIYTCVYVYMYITWGRLIHGGRLLKISLRGRLIHGGPLLEALPYAAA